MKNRILAVSSMYNVEDWIGRTINSVTGQDYENYKYALVDDMSSDKTVEIATNLTSQHNNIVVKTNIQKKYSLKNIYEGIQSLKPEDNDIIVTIDGDDWLAHSQVFNIINDTYNKIGCWVTYGSYIEYPTGNLGIESSKYPLEDLKNEQFNFRKGKWRVSHIRTFKYALWKKIKYEDFLDWNGEFYKTSIDKAFMYPMIEMAGEKSHFISQPLYVYNFTNPLNVHKVRRQLQLQTSHYLKEVKKPYSRLKSL
jgi:glycosyltransferase involved in cell wall biosynthesis